MIVQKGFQQSTNCDHPILGLSINYQILYPRWQFNSWPVSRIDNTIKIINEQSEQTHKNLQHVPKNCITLLLLSERLLLHRDASDPHSILWNYDQNGKIMQTRPAELFESFEHGAIFHCSVAAANKELANCALNNNYGHLRSLPVAAAAPASHIRPLAGLCNDDSIQWARKLFCQ